MASNSANRRLAQAAAAGDCAGIAAALDDDHANIDWLPVHSRTVAVTPLVSAVQGFHVDAVRLLLQRGASTGTVGGCSAPLSQLRLCDLTAAQLDASLAIARLLLEKGAAVDYSDNYSSATPLENAVRAGCLPAVQLLLAAGADATGEDTAGPLTQAVSCNTAGGDPAGCVEALLAAGANPRAAYGVNRYTPLHVAARECAPASLPRVARLLVDAGADVDAHAQFRQRAGTPLDFARERIDADEAVQAAVALLALGAVPDPALWAGCRARGLSLEQQRPLLL
jgi:hypothetical protein